MKFQVFALSEGAFTIDKSKIFVPFNTQTDNLQSRTTGSLLVEVQPFCIVTESDVIVLDAGLGFSQNGKLQIHQNLLENGIQPTAVTKVLLSHLHKDHAGGVSYKNMVGNPVVAFANATYYVQKREFDFAMATGYPSFLSDEFEVLSNHPNVVWLSNDSGTIDQYIHYQITKGHSPYHQVFWIEAAGKKLFFGGDDAPQLQQMKSRLVAKYDFDGKKCMELRQQWWQQGDEEGWHFLFYHDIKMPIYPPL